MATEMPPRDGWAAHTGARQNAQHPGHAASRGVLPNAPAEIKLILPRERPIDLGQRTMPLLEVMI